MYKISKIITQLQPHQKQALGRALLGNLILAHSTGSGKTLTSIAIADALNKPTTVLTPASLVENFKKELKKHKVGGPPVTVMSMPTAVSRNFQIPKGNTLIIDEAHALRNSGTARQRYIKQQLDNAGRIIALTGTPAYNKIEDWAPLVNIVAKQAIIPEKSGEFRDRYINVTKNSAGLIAHALLGIKDSYTESLKNGDELKRLMTPYVDIFDADIEKPERVDEQISVPMSKDQLKIYKAVEGNIPFALRWKLRHNMAPNKQESKMLNAFYTGVRQVSNTAEEYDIGAGPGEKLKEAAKRLIEQKQKDKNFRALVYSTYLKSGLESYASILKQNNIPYNMFTGALTPAQKKSIVDAYNNGSVPVILGSGSASEGLDLKGTKLIQILEPHFNNAKVDQVIGRGIRYKSHSHLPEDERKVKVEKYYSTIPDGSFLGIKKKAPTSVDQYLAARAEEKDKLIAEIRDVLK